MISIVKTIIIVHWGHDISLFRGSLKSVFLEFIQPVASGALSVISRIGFIFGCKQMILIIRVYIEPNKGLSHAVMRESVVRK